MSFLTTKNKIVTILEELEGTGNPLSEVFGFSEASPKAFPCAMVKTNTGSIENRLDTSSNELHMNFTIRLLHRTENTLSAENTLLAALDSILDKFRSAEYSDTLDGVVEKFTVLSVDRIEEQTDQPIIGFDIVVEAVKIKTI